MHIRYEMMDYWTGEELKIDDKICLGTTRWPLVVYLPAFESSRSHAVPAARRPAFLVAGAPIVSPTARKARWPTTEPCGGRASSACGSATIRGMTNIPTSRSGCG